MVRCISGALSGVAPWTSVPLDALTRAAPRQLPRPSGCGKGVGQDTESILVQRRGHKPRLERARRRVDPALEQGVEERCEPPGLRGLDPGVVDDGGVDVRSEEHTEHRSGELEAMGHALGGERVGDQSSERAALASRAA